MYVCITVCKYMNLTSAIILIVYVEYASVIIRSVFSPFTAPERCIPYGWVRVMLLTFKSRVVCVLDISIMANGDSIVSASSKSSVKGNYMLTSKNAAIQPKQSNHNRPESTKSHNTAPPHTHMIQSCTRTRPLSSHSQNITHTHTSTHWNLCLLTYESNYCR